MGSKQKRFGKKKHRNYKNAIEHRKNNARSQQNALPPVDLNSIAVDSSTLEGNVEQLKDFDNSQCDIENIEDMEDSGDIYIEEDLICNRDDDIEETSTHDTCYGRRIVHINPFFEAIQRLSTHNPDKKCNFSNMRLVKEFRHGLNSTFTFTCDLCQYTGVIKSNPTSTHQLEINYASVLGAYTIGTGYYQTQEFLGTLDIPYMAVSTYDDRQKRVQIDLKKTADKTKKEALDKEKQIAIDCNEVDVNGTALLSVYEDGSWPKRSYRTHYDSLSGTACLVGLHTKKIIWHGVKNKYCRTCALSKDGPPKEHTCKRNYVGPSTGMESQLVLEAFRSSEKEYGVRYHKLIADGDSKTYKIIDEAKVYRNPTKKVEKIECCLHLYRCANGQLLKVKGLSDSNAAKLIIAIKCSVKHWSEADLNTSDKIENIRKDILNAPHHIFGDHSKCHQYFCNKKKHEKDVNEIPQMKRSGLYTNIMFALGRLLENAKSLLYGFNTNFPEQFNSIVAKHLGGKRVNFCTGDSYEGRTDASVISFNTGRLVSEIRKYVFNLSEYDKNTVIYNIESTRLKRRQNPARPSYLRKKVSLSLPDKHYGMYTAQRVDKDPETFALLKDIHLDRLKELQKDRINIERETMGQANDNFRQEIQEDILTAASFGKICKASDKAYPSLVKNIRYSSEKGIKHGQIFEHTAIQGLSELLNVNIRSCGIFIDQTCEFLAAYPTGLIDDNGIVLIKFPSAIFKMDINDVIAKRKVTFWSMSRKRKNIEGGEKRIVGINKNHEWYYEIQGMLHVTQREFCIFAVWSGHEESSKSIIHEKIYVDNEFWKARMEAKLLNFYNIELLPEIIDPRDERNMPIRDAEASMADEVHSDVEGTDEEE